MYLTLVLCSRKSRVYIPAGITCATSPAHIARYLTRMIMIKNIKLTGGEFRKATAEFIDHRRQMFALPFSEFHYVSVFMCMNILNNMIFVDVLVFRF